MSSWRAALVHGAAWTAALGLPLGHVLGPLLAAWAPGGDRRELATHAREAADFQLHVTAAAVVCALAGPLALLLPLVGLASLLGATIAATRVWVGEPPGYPLAVRMLSRPRPFESKA